MLERNPRRGLDLPWSDVDFDNVRIHWRGEVDKIDYDHGNPLHSDRGGVIES